ncbi:type IV pilin protein [Alkalisalibacterium limincola]|uniref:type IV pilin protein n=1 Tax=Alkalisalibacterium limincola TaxID=2699169 RepID=UPI00164FDB8E|nr:type IV pilin protein [Alkalisalibacterium limincola]
MKLACKKAIHRRPAAVLTPGGRQAHGFTLIELMIVIAIIAVLAALAYANYTDRVVNSRRAAATTCMMEHAQFLERAYTTNMSYLGPAIPGFGCVGDLAQFYTFSVPTRTATTFTVQAVPAVRSNGTPDVRR